MSSSASALSVRTIETPGLGDRSYVAVLDGWAIAVDVQRDIDRVEEVLADQHARLAAVVETHIHNDYVTGGLGLARRHGATYVVPAGPRLGFTATRATDGSIVRAGALTLRTIDSPGHTDAHAAYSLHIEDGPAQVAFTGGSLLLGATGRTDLLGLDRAEDLARRQYWSVRRLARLLGPDARILPTHGFGSFCVAGETAPSGDTVAEQLAANHAYLLSEDEFVDDLMGRLGAYPTYYAFMGPRNAGGPALADAADIPYVDLAAAVASSDSGTTVVDVRPRRAWAQAHLAGSVSIDLAGAMATWYGWTVPIDAPVLLVADTHARAREAVRELQRIGVDNVRGVHVTPSLVEADCPSVTSARTASFDGLARRLRDVPATSVLDVRETAEWRQGHVRGARHVSAHDIDRARNLLTPGDEAWLYCGGGFRASIAGSLLERLGASSVIVDDAVSGAATAGVLWCDASGCGDDGCRHADGTRDRVRRRVHAVTG